MRRFNSSDRCFGRIESVETHHRFRYFLDEPVILFDYVVQVFDLDNFNKTDYSGKHQQDVNILQANEVCATFVHNHFRWETVVIYGLLKKQSRKGEYLITQRFSVA